MKQKDPDSNSSVVDSRPKSSSDQRQSRSEYWRGYPFCERCRRRHLGECKPRTCYTCGSPDHLRKICPQQARGDKKTADSLTLAKVFALIENEAADSKTVATSQLYSAGTLLTVLFDSRDTHSFVSTRVIDRLF